MDEMTPAPAPANEPEKQKHETWLQYLSQVDDKLIEFFHESGEKAEDLMGKAKEKVQEMLDKTDMDEKARDGWEKIKAEGKEIGDKVEERVKHLIDAGKIKWAEMTKKDEPK